MDHDQRFKILLMEFFQEFIALFWPKWSERFDFGTLEWLQQEIFADPPKGKRREIDLVVKLKVKDRKGKKRKRPWLALVHVEIESRKSMKALRKRMYEYYHELREKYGLPVLPLAIMLNVGLDGLGIATYEEYFDDFRTVDFQFMYVGLPGLNGAEYLEGENLLGAALAPLMRVLKEDRAKFAAAALERVVQSKENDYRKSLLGECVFAYSPLTLDQEREFEELIMSESNSVVRAYRKTWHEEGEEIGEERGRRKLVQELLEAKFGPLKEPVLSKLEKWPAEQLPDLAKALLTAQTLKELGLGR